MRARESVAGSGERKTTDRDVTKAIDHTNFGHAVDLLRRGFPALPSEALETSLARWMASPGHRSGKEPIGYLLTANGSYVGIGLTAVSEHHPCAAGDAGPRRRVNLASWYVEPEHRLKLPVLLRRMLADPGAVYTDLTPAPMVIPILERLGFTPMNNGVVLVNLPVAAFGRGSAATVTPHERADGTGTWQDRMIGDHIGYGCRVFDLVHEGGTSTLVFKPVRIKRVPLIELIYCEDDALLTRYLPAIARALVRAGYFGLLLDNPVDRPIGAAMAFVPFRERRRRLGKNIPTPRRIDHTYSELAFFGP